MTKEEIGNILKELRIKNGMTQKEVASKIGRNQPIIGHWETGYSQPDANTLFTLCEIYRTTVDEAFGFVKDEKNISTSEYDHIQKYRLISENDADGKLLVDSTVDYLYNRIKLVQEKDLQLSTLQEQLHIQKLHNRMCLYSYLGKIACAGTGFYFDDIPTDTIEVPYMEGADFIIGVSGESMEPTYHDGDKLYVQKINALTLGDEGIFTVRGECFVKELGERGLISRNPNYDDIEGTEEIRLIGRVLGKVEEV